MVLFKIMIVPYRTAEHSDRKTPFGLPISTSPRKPETNRIPIAATTTQMILSLVSFSLKIRGAIRTTKIGAKLSHKVATDTVVKRKDSNRAIQLKPSRTPESRMRHRFARTASRSKR